MDQKSPARKYTLVFLTIIFFAFQMYLAMVKQLTIMLQTPIHLCFALALVFLYNPADKTYQKKLKKKCQKGGTTPTEAEMNKYAWLRWLDVIFFAAIIYVAVYSVMNLDRLAKYDMVAYHPIMWDNIAMVCIVVLLLEAVRRTLGNVLFFFIIAFIVYSWLSPNLPGVLRTIVPAKKRTFAAMFEKFVEGMTMGESGVFGTPLQCSVTSLFYFIVFGAFFSECGGGQLLIDVGMKFSNKSSGGPAKAAVISSGLMGMVSGSAVANVATTGVMTIPMMKKIGYEPEEAGAIEAVASTGGQIMPPIMGVGAFIMAEQLGMNYLNVAADAILPAIAYYFGVFVLVGRLAKKRAARAGGTEDAKIEVNRALLPRLYLLLPVVVLIIAILNGNSLMRSGMYGIFVCLACNLVSLFIGKKKSGMSWGNIIMNGCAEYNFAGLKQLWKCCMDGAKSAADIAIPTAACGIIINVMTQQTSLATNLAGVIGSIGLNNLFAAMLIAMIGCMLLGMALPTVAAYLVGVTLFVPTMTGLGISPLVANMFVFYYGIMAQITPPVCVASYTAAGIADADAMKTGLRGMLFALVGFMVPFVFVYNPAVLLQGNAVDIALGAFQLLGATYFLAMTVAGFFKGHMNILERVVTFAAAMLMMVPGMITSLIGLAIGAAILFLNAARFKKAAVKAA